MQCNIDSTIRRACYNSSKQKENQNSFNYLMNWPMSVFPTPDPNRLHIFPTRPPPPPCTTCPPSSPSQPGPSALAAYFHAVTRGEIPHFNSRPWSQLHPFSSRWFISFLCFCCFGCPLAGGKQHYQPFRQNASPNYCYTCFFVFFKVSSNPILPTWKEMWQQILDKWWRLDMTSTHLEPW